MKKITLPTEFPLYESSYGSDVPFHQLYVQKFQTLPSRFSSKILYELEVLETIKKMGFEEMLRVQNFKKNFIVDFDLTITENDERIYVNESKKLIFRIHIKPENKTKLLTIDILYDIQNGEVNTQVDFNKLKPSEIKKKKANIGLIKSDMGHLDVEEYELFVPEIDLELNYGKSFTKIHDLIIRRLNTANDKGIILLHGDPGTGKTSYIKYLTKLIEDKEVLFIPPTMAETLSEPSFIPFLMDHKNSILIIEDAERVISDRELNGSSPGVSNILNLTDGILGDCLGIQIIATFNMKREKIDQALLRKGRLIAEHKFKNLTIEETNKLLNHLNKNLISKEEMSLADIYNVDTEIYKSLDKSNKIGFAS